jgi:DNA-binding transcriptional LysR family regulator
MTMELRHLRYFVAVAEELSFTRAAGRLNIAQPPLSHQIRQLETELGVALFHRTKHEVRITEAGHAVLQEARCALAQARRVEIIARRAAHGLVGKLHIGFSSSLPHTKLPNILRVCRSRFPEIALTLHEHTTEKQIELLSSGEIDVGFLRLPVDNAPASLAIKPILHEPLLLAMPREHSLGRRQTVAIQSLRDEPFILLPRDAAPGLHDQIIGMCVRAGFRPNIVQEASQVQTIISLVSAGLGIAIVPASIRSLHGERVRYRRLSGAASMTATAVAYEKTNRSMILQTFLNVVSRHKQPQATTAIEVY